MIAAREWARRFLGLTGLVGQLALAGCSGLVGGAQTTDIALIGFNDPHGNLEPPRLAISVPGPQGPVALPVGGAAYPAGTIAALKARSPHHAVVSAGDMVGALPMVSALFLDEPMIETVNQMQIDFAAVGEHEFDRGWRELLRLQRGGCEKFTLCEPCQLSKPFAGDSFGFLSVNTNRVS